MRTVHNKLIQNVLLLIPIFLTSCGGGGGGGTTGPTITYYEISGTIRDLTAAGLRLKNNGGDDITITPGNTTFTFPTPVANGAAYLITVSQQPTGAPAQICTVNNGGGNVSNANVSNIVVICSTESYTVGGQVSGLMGGSSGLVIRNNNDDSKSISANGFFSFTTPVAAGAGYNVTVLTNPSSPSQKCVVYNGVGTIFRDITDVIIDCNQSAQHFAYVANSGAGTISIYKINALTGHLQTNGSLAAGTSPEFITIDPAYPGNPYAYVVDRLASKISAYRIDIDYGTLSAVGGLPLDTGASPQPVTIDPNSQFAYVANSGSNTISAYQIEFGTGRLIPVAGTIATGSSPQQVQVDPYVQFAYVANTASNNVSGYQINPTTGGLTPIDNLLVVGGDGTTPTPAHDNFPAGTSPQSITIDPYGVYAYVANSDSNDISAYFIDFEGQLIPIDANENTLEHENFAAGVAPRSVTIDPYGLFAYVANSGSNTISAYTIEFGRLIPAGTIATENSPQPVQVDPTGQFAYVANSVSRSVSGYKINPATGALTSVGPPVATGIDPGSVSFDAFGHFAYVVNKGSARLSAYRIDSTTGVLTPVSGSPYAAESKPQTVTIDPSGRFAYVSNRLSNTISAYAIDALTRALDPVPGSPFPTGVDPQPVTVDPSGVYAYVANSGSDNITAFSIGESGELVVIGTYPTGDNPQVVTIDPYGLFAYVANRNSTTVSAYKIDGTGALTPIDADAGVDGTQNFVAGSNPVSVTIDPLGKFAYVANSGSGTVSAYMINGTTGALTSGTSLPTGSGSNGNPQSVTVDPDGQFAYVTNRNTNDIAAYKIDPLTGALTRVDANPDSAGIQNFPTAGITPLSVTISPNGAFAYVANSGSGDVSAYSIDFASGALMPIGTGTVATGDTPQAVAIDPAGSYAYVSSAGSDNIYLYSINSTTGQLTLIQTFGAGDSPVKVSIGMDSINGQLFAYVSNSMSSSVAGNVSAYTIDTTGALTPVPGSPYPTGSSPTSFAITK